MTAGCAAQPRRFPGEGPPGGIPARIRRFDLNRASAFQTKADKDVAQAVQLLEALEELRPGDVRMAWRATRARGKGWATALERGAALVGRRAPALAERLAGYT